METQMQTIQMTLPRADWAFLKRLSANMGWQTRRVRTMSEKKEQPISPALAEQIECAREEYAKGETISCSTPEDMMNYFDSL